MDRQAVLLVVLNLLLVLLVLLTRRKRKLNSLLLVLTSFVLSLSLLEVVYRLFFEREAYYAGDFNKEFYKPDSTLGFTIERAGKFEVAKINNRDDTIFKAIYTIIPDSGKSSFRLCSRIGYHAEQDSGELVFLGCSFTFGEGLNDQQTLPYLTGQLCGKNSVNLGCGGYGIHQVYQLFLEKFKEQDNSHRTFVYSFLYDHILRANGVYEWNQNGPFFIVNDDSLINAGPVSSINGAAESNFIHYVSLFGSLRFLKKLLTFSVQRKRSKALNAQDYQNSLKMIYHMATLIRQSGGSLIVIDWDVTNWGKNELSNLRFNEIEKEFDQLSSVGAHLVRVSSITNIRDAANFIPGDGHPSALMNYKIATYLEKFLK